MINREAAVSFVIWLRCPVAVESAEF